MSRIPWQWWPSWYLGRSHFYFLERYSSKTYAKNSSLIAFRIKPAQRCLSFFLSSFWIQIYKSRKTTMLKYFGVLVLIEICFSGNYSNNIIFLTFLLIMDSLLMGFFPEWIWYNFRSKGTCSNRVVISIPNQVL